MKQECFYGQEAVLETSRFAKMNMILAGDGHSNISHADSFSLQSKRKHHEKYDVILTNIPFLDKNFANFKDVYNCCNGNEISIRHCLNSINPKSIDNKILMIIPESILINDNYQLLREDIIKNTNIVAIISLPTGSFTPYARDAKTSILILNKIKKTKENIQKEVLHFEVKNIGYKLDIKRTLIPGKSDLDLFLENFDILKKSPQSKLQFLFPKQIKFISLCEIQNPYSILKPQIEFNNYWKTTLPLIPLVELIEEINDKRKEKKYELWSVTNDRGFILRQDDPKQSTVISNNNYNEKIVSPLDFAYSPARINVGSICFNNSDKTGCISGSYIVFRNKKPKIVKNEFLFILFKSHTFLKLIKDLVKSLTATVRGKCDFNHFSHILIPVPQLQIQNEIIEYAKRVETIEKKLNCQIHKLKNDFQSKVKSLFF